MNKALPELLREIQTIASESSCAKCSHVQNLQYISCGHLVCTTCLNSARSVCPVCKSKPDKSDLVENKYMRSVLDNIHNLNLVNGEQINLESPRVLTFFAPECAINKRDPKGETRLHKLCREGSVEKVEALLLTGIDVNIQDFAGWTALHEAVTAQKIGVVKLLLEYGAFVDVPGLNYATPLHAAVQDNNVPIIKLLVQYGASLLSYNKEGKTPIDLSNTSDQMTALCLTPRVPSIYKVYTIPPPKVFFSNPSNHDVTKLAKIPNAMIMTEKNLFNGNVAYLIADDKPNIKHVQIAMLQGCCVVSPKWISEATQGTPLNPLNYLADVPGYALHKAAMNVLDKLPKLFDGLEFYFHHSKPQKIAGCKYTLDDFKRLVQLGGGKVVTRRPSSMEMSVHCPYHAKKKGSACATCYLIYDELQQAPQSRLIKARTGKWLIECVNNFSLLS